MFLNLFRKKQGDAYRYWASVSTRVYDYKKGKQTDEYINATIPVRLVPDLEDELDGWLKTKNKNIQHIQLEDVEGFFEAVEPREGEPFVRFIVVLAKPRSEAD